MKNIVLLVALAGCLAAASPTTTARAFCGFYVASADGELVNNATIVVLLRDGTTTTLSMQNDYQGAPEDFALVVPVPVVLRREQVKTLPKEVFDRVETMAAPRLVEYWEEDPCPTALGELDTMGHGGGGGSGSGYGRGAGGGGGAVRVEAQFAVGEYDIVVLSARDSSALDTWLRANGYRIPEGAGEALRPYVEAGMKFFVAKVDVDRVTFDDGRALLSPLRVQYESRELSLPVRLGLLNSSGTQDLIVHVLGKGHRYEMANYPNVFITTNVDVGDSVRERFGEFYAALFDRTLERNPGAIVTEYAWDAGTCDPCPGAELTDEDLVTLGAVQVPIEAPRLQASVPVVRTGALTVRGDLPREVVRRIVRMHINEVRFCYEQELNQRPDLEGRVVLELTIDAAGRVTASSVTNTTLSNARVEECLARAGRRWSFPESDGAVTLVLPYMFTSATEEIMGYASSLVEQYVLTRLHYRYGREGVGEDLIFREAEAVSGGREIRGEDGRLEEGAVPAADYNNFQARYVIRHPWEGEIACENPVRGVWGGPPNGVTPPAPTAATGLAGVRRGAVDLRTLLAVDVPALGITGVRAQIGTAHAGMESAAAPTAAPSGSGPAAATGSGCGCRSSSARGAAVPIALVLGLVWLRARARRSPRRAGPPSDRSARTR